MVASGIEGHILRHFSETQNPSADPNQAIVWIFVTPAADSMTIAKSRDKSNYNETSRMLAWWIDSACTNRELDCYKHQERKWRKGSEKIQIFRFKRVQTFERIFIME